jgi:hypothetical protein
LENSRSFPFFSRLLNILKGFLDGDSLVMCFPHHQSLPLGIIWVTWIGSP